MNSGDDRQQRAFAVALASTVSQVGCVTVAILLLALGAGLWLDRVLDTRPLFTLLLVLASIPASLYLLVRIALSAVAQLTPTAPSQTPQDASPDDE